MTEKRPRIDHELAVELDLARGKQPFESFVRDALWAYLEIFHNAHGRSMRSPKRRRYADDGEILQNLLTSDFFAFEGDRFKAAYEYAWKYFEEEMERQRQDIAEEEALYGTEDE